MSNLKLGSGIAPIDKMFEAGVTLTLGTDGAISGNDLDMWLTMRLAASLPKGNTLDPKVMNAKTVLHMATLNGAKALGKEDKLGSLEVGKIADLYSSIWIKFTLCQFLILLPTWFILRASQILAMYLLEGNK